MKYRDATKSMEIAGGEHLFQGHRQPFYRANTRLLPSRSPDLRVCRDRITDGPRRTRTFEPHRRARAVVGFLFDGLPVSHYTTEVFVERCQGVAKALRSGGHRELRRIQESVLAFQDAAA